MNGFNLSDITDAKFGNVQVSELYFGSTKIWPLYHDYSRDYFTIRSLSNNNVINYSYTNNIFEYSIDNGTTWTTWGPNINVTLNNGGKLLVKGNSPSTDMNHGIGIFNVSGNFNVMGNIMSLIYGDNFINQTTIYDYQFHSLFYNCNKLVNASNLILPATTLAHECYAAMFSGCSSLASAPALPATTLAHECYAAMFSGCSSLASAPALPATTLDTGCYMTMFSSCSSLASAPALPATTLTNSCYYGMFSSCSSLTMAPELPATTLTNYCYWGMFSGCSMLNYVKCLATDITATNCTYQWLENVSASGTFVKYINTTWTTGISGIPVGWTVQNEGHDYSQDYLTFEALESGNFTWTGTNNNSIYYSIDAGSTWTQLASGSSTPTLNANDKILFKATDISPSSSTGIGQFSSSGQFNVMGNIMSLVYGDNFINNNDLYKNQFRKLFYNCNKLVNASNLILPATTLSSQCYAYMFNNCSRLTTTPALPATTLAWGCYQYMFYACSKLTTAPALPATTLIDYCYYGMLGGCSRLTTAPALPATTLKNSCYQYMFYYCTKLNYVKCLATTNISSNCNNWLLGVSSTGTFVKDVNTTWPTGDSGIPSGWAIQNA